MTPLEMIAEWRKGCRVSRSMAMVRGDGKHKPEDCQECTAAFINAIEAALRHEKATGQEINDPDMIAYAWRFTFNNGAGATVYTAKEAAEIRKELDEDEKEDVIYMPRVEAREGPQK